MRTRRSLVCDVVRALRNLKLVKSVLAWSRVLRGSADTHGANFFACFFGGHTRQNVDWTLAHRSDFFASTCSSPPL